MSSSDYLPLSRNQSERNYQGCLNWFKYVRIIPSVGLIITGISMNGYVISEWRYYQIANGYFPNVTLETSHPACDITNSSTANNMNIQEHAATWLMYDSIALHIPALFASFILPPRTDAHGRKFLLILASLSLCLRSTLGALAIKFNWTFLMIVITNAVDGLTGSTFTLITATLSYIADMTSTNINQRTNAVVTLEAAMMVASTVSGLISGHLIKSLGYPNASFVCSATCLVGFFVMLVLPESLTKDKRRQACSISHSLTDMTQFYISKDFKGLRMRYILLILMIVFTKLSLDDRGTLETIHFLGKPFCWDPVKVGIFSMARNGGQCLIGLVSVKLLHKFMTNKALVLLSILSNVTSFIVEAFTSSDMIAFIVPAICVFGTIIYPILKVMMSTMTSQDKQGAMFAGLGCVDVICVMFSSIVWNEIYANTLSILNGFVFLAMAGCCMIISVLLYVYWYIETPRNSKELTPLIGDSKKPLTTH